MLDLLGMLHTIHSRTFTTQWNTCACKMHTCCLYHGIHQNIIRA